MVFFFALVLYLCTAVSHSVAAEADYHSAADALTTQYESVLPSLHSNDLDIPISIDSLLSDKKASGRILGVLDFVFSDVAVMLSNADNWCDVSTLHTNIKACLFQSHGEERKLQLFVGRKHYQAPDNVPRIDYRLTIEERNPSYIHVQLSAAEGPFGTRNHFIRVAAIPIDPHHTFISLEYGYEYGMLAKIAMQGYFATLGRNKVGFTKMGVNDNGVPRYVKGMQGLVERNAMRYFLAMQAYLSVLNLVPKDRFEQRINKWYDLTQRFKRQLYEVEKSNYIDIKRRELANRIMLQRKLTLGF